MSNSPQSEFTSSSSEASKTKPVDISEKSIPEIEHRERLYFKDRRYKFVEETFLGKPPDKKEVTRPDGAKFRVLSSFCELPEHLKKQKGEDEPYVMTIYVSGMFDATKPNFGNHPLETKLASSLLTGDTDSIMMVKAEGLNSKAYQENSQGCVQKRVGEEDWGVVKDRIKALGLESKPITLRVVGYSEGSTQGASLAEVAAKSGIARVQEYVSIGGSGLAGATTQEQAEQYPLKFIKQTVAAQKPSQAYHDRKIVDAVNAEKEAKSKDEAKGKKTTILSRYTLQENPHEIYVDRKLFTGLENVIGRSKVETMDDVKNIGIWVGRLLGTEMFSKLGKFVQEVPRERLQAVTCINPAYEELAKLNVPVMVVSGTQEIFFANNAVRETMEELEKKYPNWPALLISSNISHDQPHADPKGTAYIIEAMRQKFFEKKK